MISNWQDRKRTWLRDGRCLDQNSTSSQRPIWDSILDVYWGKGLPNCMTVPRFRLWPMTWKVFWNCRLRNILTSWGRTPNSRMFLPRVFLKRQNDTNLGHHVPGIQRRKLHVHGVPMNLTRMLHCFTMMGPKGKTSHLGNPSEVLWHHTPQASWWSCSTRRG